MLDDVFVGVFDVLSDEIGDGCGEAAGSVERHHDVPAGLDHAVGDADAVVVLSEKRGLGTKNLNLWCLSIDDNHFNQCFGSGSGRIRIIGPDPDPGQ